MGNGSPEKVEDTVDSSAILSSQATETESSDDGNHGDVAAASQASSSSSKRRKKRASPSTTESPISKRQKKEVTLPHISNGKAEFRIGDVTPHLKCSVCEGLFRDPYTITQCLHTFCKTCLFQHFEADKNYCPHCHITLLKDPYQFALPDRTLQEMIDKHLFPFWKEADDAAEEEFYAKHNIKLKQEFAEEQRHEHIAENINNFTDDIVFHLRPDYDAESRLNIPALARPKTKTSGRCKVITLKKHILKELGLSTSGVSPHSVEVFCCGTPVGNELTLAFINRTIWLDPELRMTLTYRYSEDSHPPPSPATK